MIYFTRIFLKGIWSALNRYSTIINLVALTVLIGACNKASCASDKIKINIHQADDSIRKDLFNYPPRGSQADDVIELVLSRLYHEGL
jgi:hypothetical protein